MDAIWSDCTAMKNVTATLLEKHANDIKKINDQRRTWLWASSVVLFAAVLTIFGWDWADNYHNRGIWWFVTSTMIIISVNWWYWTMRVIRIILEHQAVEYALLHSLLEDVGEVKEDIKFLAPKSVDTDN